MPVVNDGDHIEARVCCSFNEQAAFNVYHYLIDNIAGAASTTTAAIAEALSNQFQSPYRFQMTDLAYYEGVGVKLHEPEAVEDGYLGYRNQGTSGDPLPRAVSGVITFTTAIAGRRGKGRKYIPWPSVEFQDPATGKPTNAYLAALEAISDAYVGTINLPLGGGVTADFTSVLAHVSGGYEVITGSIERQKWGMQRSRGDYGRPNAVPGWAT